jgi:ATP-dependent exoDNAse (exonuclease V) alpha subunit
MEYRIRSLLEKPLTKEEEKEFQYKNIEPIRIKEEDIVRKVNTKEEIDKLENCAKHTREYNESVVHLKKTIPTLNNISLIYVYEILLKTFKISSIIFTELSQSMRYSKKPTLAPDNIIKEPFEFITAFKEYIKFDKASDIAVYFEIDYREETRIKAWFLSLMHQNKSFYILDEGISEEYYKTYTGRDIVRLKISKGKRQYSYQELIDNRLLIIKTINKKQYITTQEFIDIEENCSDMMMELYISENEDMRSNPLYVTNPFTDEFITYSDIDKFIREYENTEGKFKLNTPQKEAVKKAFKCKLLCITGFPGTGKTTIVDCIIWIRKIMYIHKNISICAPTGLAYKNIIGKLKEYDLNKYASGTLHKVLLHTFPSIKSNNEYKSNSNYKDDEIDKKILEEDYMDSIDLMIIDEVSMVDMLMFKRILKYARYFNFQLILIGDINQLPSVGPGKVFENIIDLENFIDCVKLTEICRQSGGRLLDAIKKMSNSKIDSIITKPDFDNKTLHHIDIIFSDDILQRTINELITNNGFNQTNTKFICYNSGIKIKPVNTVLLNSILQRIYNGESIEIPNSNYKMNFKINDRIMLTTNSIQTCVVRNIVKPSKNTLKLFRANGDEAIILQYYHNKSTVLIKYIDDGDDIEEITTELSVQELKELYILSYAVTVHKSQGSQYENIVYIMGNTFNITKKLVFTAISRAQQQCFVICNIRNLVQVQQQKETKVSIFMKEFKSYSLEF